ncbi:16S rRNA processing protein RimM [Pseudobutyrivibrio sp. NOR37]|uniref:Ribosome maturation factor RimM n=1 Tax=Pseudobutyrivibrio xylanivorans TaxID=185007 RepID=A0A6M0LH56_PSEXY|nr:MULTISPECIES: ribosome maturation factor RimM [Pseudobutyrivibrio]NEX01219.1 16S rRNA processing protein RimM [Pseudobutyrivibrio xylanivorans]SFR65800.1 16S rRNA processing protein RimM [Pseudobutyrivibrio sp. NOR37]
MEDLYQVGSITQTHGIRGEVKVFPLTDDISRFKNMKNLLLDGGKDGYISLEVENARPQKNLVILKFKGIDNINDIEKYKGQGLYVTKENRVELKDDEYFIADLIGCEVYVDADSDKKFGTISDVMETGANDVYEITLENGKTVLVPAIKECILNVDIEGGRVDIHLLEGLMD